LAYTINIQINQVLDEEPELLLLSDEPDEYEQHACELEYAMPEQQ